MGRPCALEDLVGLGSRSIDVKVSRQDRLLHDLEGVATLLQDPRVAQYMSQAACKLHAYTSQHLPCEVDMLP